MFVRRSFFQGYLDFDVRNREAHKQTLNGSTNNYLFSLSFPGCVSTQRQDRLQGAEAAAVRALQATGVAEIARTRPGDTARAEAPAEDHLRLLIMIILLAKQATTANKLQILARSEVNSACKGA